MSIESCLDIHTDIIMDDDAKEILRLATEQVEKYLQSLPNKGVGATASKQAEIDAKIKRIEIGVAQSYLNSVFEEYNSLVDAIERRGGTVESRATIAAEPEERAEDAADDVPVPQAAASSEAVSVSEPVKWFGSEEKANEWIEKQSSPSEYRIEPNNRRFEIFKNDPSQQIPATSENPEKIEVPRWWRDSTPAQRRELLSKAGYTDADQARVLSGTDWNQLTDPVRRALSASPVPAATPAYGQTNKVFTQDAAERAREILRSKLNQLNTGLDPEIVQAGITLAGYHIEAGARSFAAYSKAMLADLGEAARPYLRSWYEGVRYYPGFNSEGMSTADEIVNSTPDNQPSTMNASEEVPTNGIQKRVPTSNADTSPENLSLFGEDGGDGRSPATEERRGAQDVQRADSQRTEATQRPSQGAMGEGGRGAGVRGTDRVPAGRPERTERPAAEASRVKGENYAIEPGALQETRGRVQKARDNIRAIELMREIEAEGRTATRAEQEQLARYVGWGGIKGAFPDPNTGKFEKGFEQVGERLKELLSETEYATARRSLQYAHYTAESVVRSMWDAVQRLGFTGGKVFEPGMGVGNFPGLMPADIAVKTDYNGLELDHTTARIARLLYPKWGIRQDDFTRAPLPKDTYDLVIGNPPFADVAIKSDPAYQQGFLLHDYFFAKSLDAVRPGGLLAFISSAGTMNKMDSSAREYMADRADFVGAIRLPGNAFEKNAGTSVTTDIIFLRKRIPGEENQKGRGFIPRAGWTDTVEVTLPNKEGRPTRGLVNRYFTNFPNMVLGEEGFFDPLYEGRYGVRAPNNFDIDVALNKAISNLPESIMSEWQGLRGDVDFGTSERKEGSFYVGKDGRLMQQRDGVGQAVGHRGKGVTGGKSLAEIERIKALIPLRDSLRAVYAADLAGDTANADTARKRLNDSYDAFVKKFGPINQAEFQYRRPTIIQQESARMEAREEARFNGLPWQEGSFDASRMIQDGATLAQIARARADARENAQKDGRAFDEGSFDPDEMPDVVIEKRPNIDPFMDDPESYRLRSIEKYNDESGEARKSAVFTENVITRERTPEIKSVNDALLWTLNQKGRLDITDVSRLAGISESETIEQLGENIYRVPGTDNQWVTRDEYLSGNVRRKLRQARAAAARDQSLQRNVDALEAAQPAPLPPSEINANLGMPWIPTEIINQFGTESLGLTRMSVKYTPALGQWEVSGDSTSAAAQSTWGTKDRSAPQLVADALNRQDPRIYREGFADGKKTRELDPVATEAAQEKVREIKQRFSDWVWSDPARANRLAELYNEEYNNLVVREFDGSYLTTPGISSAWTWRPHQTRVIARVIQDGNTYMAHSVGAGKTSAMIGAGMEMRRLGLVRKPMYSVPNHMLGQFTKEFYEQYPTARIAVADERRFHTDRRKQFIADVANEDLDAIIITHSAFGMIPISDEFQDGLIQEQIEQYRDILSDVEKDQDARITRNRLENQIERLEQRLSGRGQRKRDQVFTFEEMGVDFLFVDEAHLYRKLDFATKMSNVKGISPEGSKASWDLYVKTRYLETINPGRNLVLASGTPVTNTMAELFTVSRYLQPQELRDRGLEHFDAWAGAFGDTVTNLEQDPSGGYKPTTRFAKFVNVPELSNMVRQTMDVVTGRQLEQYVTRPKIKGGTRKMNLAEKTEALEAYQAELARRMVDIANRKGPPKPGDDIILSVINDGRHSAIDMRLVDPALPNDAGSKLNLLIDNVYRIWSETKRQPFHKPAQDGYSASPVDKGPAAQMIFANLGLSGSRGFSVPDFIRADLQRRGVPKSEIAYISDYKTHVARQRLFNDVNEGKVRILIGSTAKMATGVNAQRRLYALHNLDPLWYPADDEQRNGRILRQGNMNPEIEIHDYSTKGTYDSTMWGLMETKARFIQGFFEGDPNLRDMDDLGEASQYEQAKAMTTADPRLIELTDLRQKLERAHRRKAAFERELYANAQRVSKARDNISYYSKRIPAIEADIARRQDVSGDAFKAVVDGKTYTDRVEAGDILLGRIDLMKSDGREHRDEKVGEIGGFDILADVWGTSKERQANLVLNRTDDYQTEVKMSGSATGVIQSLSNALRNFDIDLDEARVRLQRAEKTVVEFAPQIDKEFTGQGEIDQLIEQVRGLERELQSDASQSPVDESAQIDTPAFSRNGKAKAFIPIDRAKALVSAITGRLENAPEVIVVQSMQDDQVPEAVRREDARQRSQGASGEPEGFYYRGKAYIVLDGLSRRKGENDAQALLRVFSHEILGHAGLRGLFRSDLDAVLNEVSLKRLSDVRKKATEYGLDMADKRQRMEAAEEVLAEMAQTQPENSLVTKAIEAVRRALRRLLMRLPADIRAMLGGGKFTQWVNAMTDAEIIDRFIVPAREFIRGGTQAGMDASPVFTRAQSEFDLDQYTEEDVNRREKAERDRKSQTAKALQKQAADDQLDEFVLTGSDSVADQAAARGQGSLFSRSKALPDTIDIDGVQRPTTNSNGQLIAQTEEGVRNFWAWFGDSKVVDDQGRPLVYYRMTDSDRTEFRKSWRGGLIYFAATPEGAGVATRAGSGTTYPVYLKAEKIRGQGGPGVFYADAESKGYEQKLIDGGFDAVKVRDEASRKGGTLAVLDPTQIKSAIGNTGAFDPADSDIRFSRSSVMDFFEQEQESEFAQENRRLREADKTLWNKSKTLLRRQFAPGGLLPDSVFREKIARDGKLNVVEITVQSLVKEIEEAVRKEYGAQVRNLNETDMRRLSDALAGKMPANMKERTKTAIVAMRQYIDHLSSQYTDILRQQINDLSRGMDDGELMLLDAFLKAGQIEPEGDSPAQKGAATRQRNKIMEEAREAATAFWGDGKKMQAALGKAAQVAERASLMNIILNNQGQYVHRSYQVFDDPYWFRKIDPAVFDNAMNYLIDRYLEDGTMSRQEAIAKAEKVIDQIVKTDTAYSDMESFIKESKLGAKDLSVLKKRKDIAPEIRALMGEYIDPRINFAKTATKMGRLIFNQKFLDNVLEKGMGTFLFTEEEAPVGTEEIAAEGSEVYAPLNGLYAPREVIQAFKDVMGKEQMADWYRMIVQFNGLVKGGKTILSPTTSARNFQSAMFFALANGHWDLTQAKKSMALYRTFDSPAKLAYVKKMIDLGVIYDNPHAQEMMALLSESKFDSMFASSQTAETIRNAWNLARDIYSFGDDFWKVIGFENEKAKLMKHAGMSEAAAEREAADRIRNLYPTYSMVGSAIQWLRRFPLVGTFVSFPAEIIRTSANMMRTVRKDWKTPGMRRIAIDRALGMAFVSGFAYAAQEIAKAMLDIDDDDEEAIRLQAAPWQRNSNLVITGRDEEGNLQYFDISFLDPYNYFKRPITAIMRDQPMGDALVSAASDMLSPFLGTDIAAGAIMEVYSNKTGTGGPVYKESDSLDRQLIDIAQHLRKALQPGFVSNLERTYQALDGQTNASGKKFDLVDEGLSWIGWRVSTLDPKTALYYRSFEFSDAKAEASKTLTEVLNDPNDVSQQSIERAYERAVKMRAQAYNDMSKIVGASRRSGLSATQIRMVLKSGNVSEQDRQALIDGDVPAWRPTQQAETAAVRRAEALIGREKAMEIRSRYRMVRTLD